MYQAIFAGKSGIPPHVKFAAAKVIQGHEQIQVYFDGLCQPCKWEFDRALDNGYLLS
jgi:hypothetical protein